MIGQTISHYKIIEKIGQGGMGVVYRAEDTNLSRDVAIKVLPEQFTKDPQRLARFEREAKLLASLNHPNIAAIYGLEEAGGVRFLALELVEGETLADLLNKGPVPVEKTLELCRQIAEGVEAAHEKGVIHRDLKPANVKVTPEGKIKILDFGLAKAFEGEAPAADISQSPTLTEEMTQAGVILGTAAYMSPEQARGNVVDKRSDVFAFGCVLYELLTGTRAFGGETVTDTLAKILEGEPDWNLLSPAVPSTIRFLMGRCLQKDPGKRLQHIDGARILIEEALTGTTTASAIGLAGAPQPARWRQTSTLGVVALIGVAIGVALWSLISPSTPPQQSLNRFVITPSSTAPLAEERGPELAISSDGKHIVYLAETRGSRQLYVRSLDDFVATPIPGTEGAEFPFFSPDGEWLAFFADQKLKKISLNGGPAITLSDLEAEGRGGSWVEGTIVYGSPTGLYRVSADGGEPETLATVDHERSEIGYGGPTILPGGKAVLFDIGTEIGVPSQVAVVSLETGEKSTLLEEDTFSARYVPTGHLIYSLDGSTLMAVPFDPERLEVTGSPVPVLQGVRSYSELDLAFSPNGTLIYVPNQAYSYNLVWVDRTGNESLVTQEKRAYGAPRISPDGQQVILQMRTVGPPSGAEIYDLERDSFSPLTVAGGTISAGIWAPDGEWLTFHATVNGQTNIYRQLADRSALPEQLTLYTDVKTKQPNSWSPDGRVLALHRQGLNSNFIWDIEILNTEEDEEGQPFVVSPGHECCSKFSPDGKWLAYVAAEEGRNQVYVRPYPGPDIKFLVSVVREGGGQPVWSPDGKELFYRSGEQMMAVSIQTDPTFRAGRPEVLFEGSYRSTQNPGGLQYYDLSPDGQRFLMVKKDDDPAQINVVLNWFEELKRLMPTN